VTRSLPVIAILPNPYRFLAYMDTSAAHLMNLEGIANGVQVTPAPGVSIDEVRRALFREPSVASTQPVGTFAETIRESISQSLGILRVVEGAVLLLALLIAFNSTSINVDERARENATMFAFGLPLRSVLGTSIAESLVTGIVGTLIGVAAGRLLLQWMVTVLLPSTLPDLGIVVDLALRTLVTAVVLGVVAVALAPTLTVRRLRRMDISSTLRVVE
jgi:putative ABC transport system permease protein